MAERHQERWFSALHVAAPLLVGLLVYLAWRTPDLLLFRWLDAAGLSGAVAWLRAACAWRAAPGWVVYCLPDGLWVYAVASYMALVWRGAPGRARWLWMATAPLTGTGWELAQAGRLVPGTFDPVDLLVMLLAGAMAYSVHRPAAVHIEVRA